MRPRHHNAPRTARYNKALSLALACGGAMLLTMPADALEPLSPLAAVAKHCGAPDPSQVAPKADAVLTELSDRLAPSGWNRLGEVLTDGEDDEAIVTLSQAGVFQFVQLSRDTQGGIVAKATNTTSGRGAGANAQDPSMTFFGQTDGDELLLVAAYRYQNNDGINLRCVAFGHEAKETAYMDAFEPKSVLQIVLEKQQDPSFRPILIGNTNHTETGEGYHWGEAQLMPLDASKIGQRLGQAFPFTLKMDARASVNAPDE